MNTALTAAFDSLSTQPGVAPEQSAQLHAAITRDATLLDAMNQHADSGHLKGFALAAPGAAPDVLGTYTRATGVVTLPPASLPPAGLAPSADLVASLHVQEMAMRYAHSSHADIRQQAHPVNQHMASDLQDTLDRSHPEHVNSQRDSVAGTAAALSQSASSQAHTLPPAAREAVIDAVPQHAASQHAGSQSAPQDEVAPRVSGPRRSHHPMVAEYLAALQKGDLETARTASMGFAASDHGQQMQQENTRWLLARQQSLPERDHPLFVQALTHLDRLGPDAGGYRDRLQMESLAGVVAQQASQQQMPAIDRLVRLPDGGGLLMTWQHPDNALLHSQVRVDPHMAATQPLADSLQQLAEQTRRQHEVMQQQVDMQQRSTSR